MTPPRFPAITVPMVGEDGNAFAILGRCQQALRRGLQEQGYHPDEIQALCAEFITEATTSDYDHLLRTVMAWFDVDGDSHSNQEHQAG